MNSNGGREKDGKPKEPKKPQITGSDALQVGCSVLSACFDDTNQTCTASKQWRCRPSALLRHGLLLF